MDLSIMKITRIIFSTCDIVQIKICKVIKITPSFVISPATHHLLQKKKPHHLLELDETSVLNHCHKTSRQSQV